MGTIVARFEINKQGPVVLYSVFYLCFSVTRTLNLLQSVLIYRLFCFSCQTNEIVMKW